MYSRTLFLIFGIIIQFSVSNICAQPTIELELFTSGISSPVVITHAGDSRLFIVSKHGKIHISDSVGTLSPTPFLDIDPQVNSVASERGLLGLTFHPDYTTNGFFYVNYTNSSGNTVISRFSVSTDPDLADPTSESVLLTISQPFSNHNAGDLAFGPDGYLYIPTGDGGSGGDPNNYAQRSVNLLGKILRIDVNSGSPYGIPTTNPFVNDPNIDDEIWALGLRNPWRISFDRETGDLWIADVGQGDFEEISRQPANSPGGENYGWRCYEGFASYNLNGCPGTSTFTAPVHAYDNTFSVGESVTGGYVYRGAQYPLLQGHYLFGDYVSSRFWTLSPDTNGQYTELFQGKLLGSTQVSTFGEDLNGELYVAALGEGKIYRIKETCSAFQPTVSLSNDTLFASGTGNSYQWFLNGNSIMGATLPYIVPTVSGTYTVQLDTSTPCGTLTSAPFEQTITALSSLEVYAVAIFPNPMQTEARLEFDNPNASPYTLTIRDVAGRIVREVANIRESSVIISRETLPAGLYAVSLSGPKQFAGKLLME